MEIADLNNQKRRHQIELKTSQGHKQNLENDKLDLDHKIKILAEENSTLLNDRGGRKAVINDYEQRMRRLNDEILTHQENIGQLEHTITSQDETI